MWTEAALERGLHVFVEKPPSLTAGELVPLARLAQRDGLIVMVGTMWRYSQAIGVFQEWQAARPNSSVQHMSFSATFPTVHARPDWNLAGLKLAFYEQFLHALDCSCAMMGHPSTAQVFVTNYDGRSSADCSRHSVTVILSYDDSRRCALNLHSGSHSYQTHMEMSLLDGTHARLEDFTDLAITTTPSWSGTKGGLHDHPTLCWQPGRLYLGYARHGYAEEFSCFARSILTKATPPTDLNESIRVMSVLDACIRSLEGAGEVEIKKFPSSTR